MAPLDNKHYFPIIAGQGMAMNDIYSEVDYSSEDTITDSPGLLEFTPTNGNMPQRHQLYSGHLYDDSMSGLNASEHCTPSRHREKTLLKRQTYPLHPYAREVPFQNCSRPVSDTGMLYSNGNSRFSSYSSNDEMATMIESQRAMMKAQENLIEMVKKVSERVEDLEKSLTLSATSSSSDDMKKIPTELSVSYSNTKTSSVSLSCVHYFRRSLLQYIMHLMMVTNFSRTKGKCMINC